VRIPAADDIFNHRTKKFIEVYDTLRGFFGLKARCIECNDQGTLYTVFIEKETTGEYGFHTVMHGVMIGTYSDAVGWEIRCEIQIVSIFPKLPIQFTFVHGLNVGGIWSLNCGDK
jgi:hypothetical protein